MFTVGALVIITPLTWLRSFKILAYAAILGNVCLLAGVIGVIGFGYSEVYVCSRVLPCCRVLPCAAVLPCCHSKQSRKRESERKEGDRG